MRLLHPRTIEIIATCDDSVFVGATSSRKQVLSHAWSEVFKYLGQKKSHPKVFINDMVTLGEYLRVVYDYGVQIKCNMNKELVKKYDDVYVGFNSFEYFMNSLLPYEFDDNYLFSDATSLYFKGINIFPEIFGDEWRKYVPVESLKEIQRQVNKTIEKR